MIKQTRFIKICVDTAVISSMKAPEPIDEWDGSCPACGSSRYEEALTIVQHGFITDDCVTIVTCKDCHESFHYYYAVMAACLDQCLPLEMTGTDAKGQA